MPWPRIDELHRLARLYGVRSVYRDVFGQRRQTPDDAIVAVLTMLGAPLRGRDDVESATRHRRQELWRTICDPVVAVAAGREGASVQVRLPRSRWDAGLDVELDVETAGNHTAHAVFEEARVCRAAEVESQRFVEIAVPLPALPPGYHRLRLTTPGAEADSLIVSVPGAGARGRGDAGRRWGVFLPLYALRHDDDRGVGDLGGLGELIDWLADQGAGAVATLPLLAIDPREPSPYAALSRRFWSELYADLQRAPELLDCPDAAARLRSPAFGDAVEELRRRSRVDHVAVAELCKPLLGMLARCCLEGAGGGVRRDALRRFQELHPDVERYATWRAVAARHGNDWRRWPAEARDGRPAPRHFDAATRNLHVYAQFLLDEQLGELSRAARRRDVDLLLDLPLGTPVSSFDVWAEPHLYALGARLGAPPDTFFRRGQDWGLPPVQPAAARRTGYRHLVECLRHHLRVAGTLRIDHVMGLERLFWIPEGFEALDGAYVHYAADELFGVVALEAWRHRATIVGEDLGTVPRSVRRRMREYGLRSTWVLQTELPSDATAAVPEPPQRSVATLNTHDMPPFAGWWQGCDLDDLAEIGHLEADETETERGERQARKQALIRLLAEHHLCAADADLPDLLGASLDWIAVSPATDVVINLEDLWLESQPQNVPGTANERPNWRRRARHSLSEIRDDARLQDLLRRVDAGRRASRHRVGNE